MLKNNELNINRSSNLRWKLGDQDNQFSTGQVLPFKTAGKPL
ncbi:MAG: hypothetical protein ACHBN1_11360 [Heteroscytonema crispum UTEX LB 1556]